jgi:ATP-dependent exoDNAse (exonuclease V) beta subunit
LSEVVVYDDWNEVQERLRRNVALAPEHREIIQKSVETILRHEAMKRFFEVPHAQVFAERALSLPSGKVGRPDRVVQLDGIWHVIDYKTGKPAAKHVSQVQEYCAALSGAGTGQRVQGWVFYTSDMRIELVQE